MEKNEWIIKVFFLLVLSSSFQKIFGELNGKLTSSDDEDESEDLIIKMRNDPSDTSGSNRDPISKVSQIVRLGFSEEGECPHSCFCEVEESYVSCIGDGQWNPPLIPSSLSRLELRSFFIPELETACVHLQGLKELQLQQCNLSKLHEDAFSKVTTLDRLDLSRNHLELLGPNQLRGLSSLKHLDLSSNDLKTLNRPFMFLTELEHLNLKGNKLKELDADTFDGLDKVQYVNLDGNNISSVSVASFQHLGSLAHLILSNNPLSNLARLNFFGSRLQYIDVSNIGIERVPQALTQFVRDLRLAKNNVREIHRGDLDSYPYLGLLVLDDNGLEILEEDALGRHEYLARLWLNGNKLKAIPQSLPISLKALYIEENSITHLSDTDFAGLNNLEQIFMQRNNISKISKCAFCDLLNLKTLDLQANNITNISQSIFQKLSRLETLDLSQNPITLLNANSFKGLGYVRVLQFSRIHTNLSVSENLFDPLKSLQILEMYGSPNLVQAIINSTRLLHSLRSVRELNLMHNEISGLRRDFFNFFPKLNLIKISGNIWDCSRKDNILWLKNLLQNSQINFYRSFSIRCNKPLALEFKPILLLDDTDFPREVTPKIVFTTQETLINSTTTNTTIHSPLVPVSFIQSDAKDTSDVSNEVNTSLSLMESKTLNNNENIVKKIEKVSKTLMFSSDENYSMENNNLYDEILNIGTVAQTENDTIYLTTPGATSSATHSLFRSIARNDFNTTIKSVDYEKNQDEKTNENSFKKPVSHKPLYWSIYNKRPEKVTKRKPVIITFSNKKSFRVTKDLKYNNTFMGLTLQNRSQSLHTISKDAWKYKEDTSHSNIQHRNGVSVHSLHKKSSAILVGASIVSACIGIGFIFGGFILAKGISRKKRRLNIWENSRSSYWNWRDGDEGESISEGVIVGIGDPAIGITRETEGTVGFVTESHHGLNNRLYLLLQRDSSTGITPETLPDPTVISTPSVISSEKLNNNNNNNQNNNYNNNSRFFK
ncbi:UNVERIFIED_CONTAM: hypothetical protein RMT77_016403 [Armadillidium vulgare]